MDQFKNSTLSASASYLGTQNPVRVSESQEITSRIHDKLDSLFTILDPIYVSYPVEPGSNKITQTKSRLLESLESIESRITILLDGIKL